MVRGDETDRDSWFDKNPKKATFLVVLLILLVPLAVAESYLRLRGEKGGVDLPSSTYVDDFESIEIYDSFYTDDEGVFKANRLYDWRDGKYGDGVRINSEGFRGLEFKDYEESSKKILFLGDSFTWGASAEPIEKCFVDLISSKGYVVFNTGIPGTGPTQYAYLAEKYVPRLTPDIVALVIYMGNDIYARPDPMIPRCNLYHVTNAGWLYGFDENGKPLSVREAYYRYYHRYYNRQSLKNRIKYLMMSSAVSRRIWLAFREIRSSTKPSDKSSLSNYLRSCLRRIQEVCNAHGSEFMLFVLPVSPRSETRWNSVANNIDVFDGFEPIVPDFLTSRHYTKPPDNHFNNAGHREYAEFIIRSIEKQMR